MSFLAPGWLGIALLGLAAAAVPIIIHLLFKTRYRVIPWGAMQFLRKSLEQTTRRIKFRELILLLLRIALLVLLAFALMRPSSRRATGQGGAPVDAVFILDVSGSMAVVDAGRTRLEAARSAALRMLDALPPQSTVRILRVAAHTVDLGPASPTNRDQARFVLQQLEQTHEATHWLPALQRASEVLTRGSLANKEVYLFSDMHRLGWETDGPAVQSALGELQQLGEVILVHAGTGQLPSNATLQNLRPQVALPAPGERVPFIVEVRNTGPAELHGMTVALRGADAERDIDAQPVPPLKPGETAALTLTARLDRRGKNLITAELLGDQLAVDNRLDHVIETREGLKVLILDGRAQEPDPAKTSSYFLAHALRSARVQRGDKDPSPIVLDIVPPETAYPALLADVQVCFLVGVGLPGHHLPPEFATRLDSFIRSGGGIIAFAEPGTTTTGLEALADMPARWSTTFTRPDDQPLTFDIKSIPSHSFLSAFRHAPLDRLGQTETITGRQLDQVKPDAQLLLRFSDGTPALVAGQRGQGTIILSATAADLRGSDAPLRPSFVPLIQALVGHVLNQQSGRKNLLAGETYSWSPRLDFARQRFQLVLPTGLPRPLGIPQVVQQHPLLTTSDTSQAGFYRLVPEGSAAEETGGESGAGDLFAVAPDPAETADLTTLTEPQINERLSRPPVHLQATQLTTDGVDRSRVQREWTDFLLWLMLALCLGELAFSWYCNREV
jgi:hypothetical protein